MGGKWVWRWLDGLRAIPALDLKQVTGSVFLRREIEFVVHIGWETVGDPLTNRYPKLVQRRHLVRIVGHQPNLGGTHLMQHFGRWAIYPFIGVEPELLIGINCIEAFILKGISS